MKTLIKLRFEDEDTFRDFYPIFGLQPNFFVATLQRGDTATVGYSILTPCSDLIKSTKRLQAVKILKNIDETKVSMNINEIKEMRRVYAQHLEAIDGLLKDDGLLEDDETFVINLDE